MLEALSRDSVTNGGLAAFASIIRCSRIIQEQAIDPKSDIVGAVWKIVRKESGLEGVSRDDVSKVFKELVNQPIKNTGTGMGQIPEIPPASQAPSEQQCWTLKQFKADSSLVTGTKPAEILFPDGKEIPLESWISSVEAVLTWLSDNDIAIPAPFPVKGKRKRYFINDKPYHPDPTAKHRFVKVRLRDTEVYVDSHRSAHGIVVSICQLCESVNVDTSRISVKLR